MHVINQICIACIKMRRLMVEQKDGQSRLNVRVHMDDMKRVTVREQVVLFLSYNSETLEIVILTSFLPPRYFVLNFHRHTLKYSFDQDYFYHNISNTPFTLGIVFPDKYGKYRVVGGLEVNDPSNRQRNGDRKCF